MTSHSEHSAANLSPAILITLVLVFSIMFFIVVALTLPGRSILEFYRFFTSTENGGFSIFSGFSFIVLLFIYLIASEAIIARRDKRQITAVLCLISLLPLAAVSAFLVNVALLPQGRALLSLGPEWETFDQGPYFVGKVIEKIPYDPTPHLVVALEDGTKAVVTDTPIFDQNLESPYVVLSRLTGRNSGAICHQLQYYLLPGESEILRLKRLGSLE